MRKEHERRATWRKGRGGRKREQSTSFLVSFRPYPCILLIFFSLLGFRIGKFSGDSPDVIRNAQCMTLSFDEEKLFVLVRYEESQRNCPEARIVCFDAHNGNVICKKKKKGKKKDNSHFLPFPPLLAYPKHLAWSSEACHLSKVCTLVRCTWNRSDSYVAFRSICYNVPVPSFHRRNCRT